MEASPVTGAPLPCQLPSSLTFTTQEMWVPALEGVQSSWRGTATTGTLRNTRTSGATGFPRGFPLGLRTDLIDSKPSLFEKRSHLLKNGGHGLSCGWVLLGRGRGLSALA